ncbi:acetyltransferase-like isoleucine patch superfamily enzyme [Mariniflexile fucanivorans]|uniref:Acetyltransferase-like isoleucine patch superfamily enzyme n=1 Tax=Mariniflexile fucanivorans TaxID=264023 RepID=A0A4V2QET6_9FLAO|nr:acyltransferase [Mariniflexile fucanivorans]TCL69237.1 acetyltransferase-like isoleucine patch superfamily enzyme [Mariniflexile fucanivorans]
MTFNYFIMYVLGRFYKIFLKIWYRGKIEFIGNGVFLGKIICKGSSVKIYNDSGFVVFSKFVFIGNNITINFINNARVKKCSFIFKANNCSLSVEGSRNITNTIFEVLDNDCSIIVGENTGLNTNRILVAGKSNYIKIGKECVFAENAEVWASDTHSILDLKTNRRINLDKPIIIGDYVWIGNRALILKGSEIGNNSIIGANSTVTDKFKKNVLLAGTPAKEIKEGVYWDINRL